MGNMKYAGWIKFLAVLVQQFFTVLLIICILLGAAYLNTTNSLSNMLETRSFEGSDYFTDLMVEKAVRLSNYINQKSKFETDGTYDPKKIVDIKDYVMRDRITGEAEGSVGYYLEDLLKWAQEGLVYSDVEVTSAEDAVDAEEGSEVLASDALAGTASAPDSSEISVADSDVSEEVMGDMTDIYWETRLDEYYLPADGISINDRTKTQEERQELYDYLEQTVTSINGEVLNYKRNVTYFDQENTNMRFFVLDKNNGHVYTNIEQIETMLKEGGTYSAEDKNEQQILVEDATNEIRKIGTYFLIDSSDVMYESDRTISESSQYNLMTEFSASVEGDYYIGFCVDTNFPVEDSLSLEKKQYDSVQPWFRMAFFGGLTAAFLAFILFIYLTFASGHRPEDEEIHLNWFDRIKTEIAAGIMFTLGLVIVSAVQWLEFDFDKWAIACVGVWGFVLNAAFLTGYFSMVRRIKAGTFWKNSILYMIFRSIAFFVTNRKITTKTLVSYLLFLIANGLLIWMGAFGLFLAVLLDLFVGMLLMKEAVSRKEVLEGVNEIKNGDLEYKIDTMRLKGEHLALAEAINHIGEGLHNAVDASMKNERLKTDLITNVSHDIKTPLTSIINYVDLLKRENIQDKKIRGYIEVLENKSQRLKHLTEDLVEASKISSGNIVLEMEKINFVELVNQTAGEFSEKFTAKGLEFILRLPEETVVVEADGRRIWRVIENIYNNVAKYAMPNTRVYADLEVLDTQVVFSVKNISECPLNIKAEELTERFIRGDISRSTEGSGLGLSIAKNLTELQKGTFEIYLDGDLFRVTIRFPRV